MYLYVFLYVFIFCIYVFCMYLKKLNISVCFRTTFEIGNKCAFVCFNVLTLVILCLFFICIYAMLCFVCMYITFT